MKKLITVLLLMVGITSFSQCNLNISWTYNINGSNIEFTNTSTGVPSSPQFAWLYDGQSSGLENPTFPYDSTVQTVCFAIYGVDSNGVCEDSICGPLNNNCTLNITWTSCIGGGNITFNNTSTGTPSNASFAWLYNGQSSDLEHPTFTYAPGVNDVCFAITDNDNPNCQDSICGPVNDTCGGCTLNISWVSSLNGNNINFYSTSTGVPIGATYWWDYGTQYSSDMNPVFAYDSTASFVCLTIMDSTGMCSDTLCGPMNFDSSATVHEINEIMYQVYPNPVHDQLNISFNEYEVDYELSIIDLSGRIIIKRKVMNNFESIDVSGLESGTYLLFIDDLENPQRRKTEKIIKY